MSNTKIVRLNASALYALGMDRPTVEALINGLRITGNDSSGITVPELAEKNDESSGAIQDIQGQIVIISGANDFLQYAPAQVAVSERVEALQTEVRQIAEQVSLLAKLLQEDFRPSVNQVSQAVDHIQTEIRQIAEQAAIDSMLIQELKQGTML
jgi:hypothetical protein